MSLLADVYLLNAEALARELRAGTLSEDRAVKHLIVAFVLGGFGFEVPLQASAKQAVEVAEIAVGFVGFALVAVVTYYGVWLLHQVNSKGDGQDFFRRLAVLSLPVGVRLVLVFLVVGALLLAATAWVGSVDRDSGAAFAAFSFTVASVAFAALFFLRMRRYMAIAAGSAM